MPTVTTPENHRVIDQRIDRVVPLTTPALLLHELPLDDALTAAVLTGRRAVGQVLDRTDDRLLVVVGPCSVHDPAAALDYAHRLRAAAERVNEDLLVVMRVYFEKPRSTVGWKGLINDPGLDGSGDVNTGLRRARALLLDVLRLGLPVGCEFLDPITPQYIADTVAWGAIGARTVESQVHRQLASGLSMPIGMKNRPDGSIATAVDAIRAAGVPHVFPGIDVSGTPAIMHTRATRTATWCCGAVAAGRTTTPSRWPVRWTCCAPRGCRSGWWWMPATPTAARTTATSPRSPPTWPGRSPPASAASWGSCWRASWYRVDRTSTHPRTHLRPVGHRRLHRLGHHRRGARRTGRRRPHPPRRRPLPPHPRLTLTYSRVDHEVSGSGRSPRCRQPHDQRRWTGGWGCFGGSGVGRSRG